MIAFRKEKRKKCFAFFLSVMMFLCVCSVYAQNNVLRGKVINSFTNEVIPFASVYWKKYHQGNVTDSLGIFVVKKTPFAVDTLVLSYVGYDDVYYFYDSSKKDTADILLSLSHPKFVKEVTVKAKFSRGLRWWKNVVTHKQENNPYQFNNYSCELYNKLELDINNISRKAFQTNKILKPFAFVLDNIDSTSEVKPFLPVFLTESISDYYFSNNPHKIREEIKALQTQGIKNETVMQFLGGVNQKINVYEDYINIFGKEFISPLSRFGDKYYNYRGKDTQVINHEKYFHLIFSPKQDGNNTFTGDCWIHSTTWAILKMNLDVSATANINFVNRLSIIQEFALINKKWVFAKDKFIADLSPFKKEKISFTGRKTTMYKDVQVNQSLVTKELSKNKLAEEVIVKEDAKTKANTFWNAARHEPLSLNESKVYKMIDTLKHLPLFQKYSNTIQFIFDGHKKLGAVEIGPWFKWVSGNQLEKIRLRFDLGTTPQFSEHLRLSGYLAYGFKDDRVKQKFAIDYKINHHESWRLNTEYLNDIDNGRIRYNNDDDATTDNVFSQLIRRQGIPQKFIGIEEYKFGVEKKFKSAFSSEISFSRKSYQTYYPLPSQAFFSANPDGKVINTEAQLYFRYAPGEKNIERRRNRTIHLRSNLPVVELTCSNSFLGLFDGEYNFQKLAASVSQTFRIKRWGQINYMAYAGKYFGDSIPFMLLEIHPGNEIYYYNKQSFNLMNRFEYFSDKYAGFNVEYNFEKKLINLIPFLRKTNTRQFVNIKTVWGDLSPSDRIFNRLEFASYRLKRLRGDSYTEIGTGIDNIFRYLRVDLVWRFAPKFTPPANSMVINNPQDFAVFGSFHLQF